MYILAIDPGQNGAMAVFKDKELKSHESFDCQKHAQKMFGLKNLKSVTQDHKIECYEAIFDPLFEEYIIDHVVSEHPTLNSGNAVSKLNQCEYVCVIRQACRKHKIPLEELCVPTIKAMAKKVAFGDDKDACKKEIYRVSLETGLTLSKSETMASVCKLYGFTPKYKEHKREIDSITDGEADAIAIGLAFLNKEVLK